MQTRGYNGFSYADVAAEIGISKASLHHHFRTKAALGAAIMQRYADGTARALADIEADEPEATERLARFSQLYVDVLRRKRLCLGAMLAAEFGTLPGPMQKIVRQFFRTNHDWLQGTISHGRKAGSLAPQGTDAEAARVLLSGLAGAMLVARPQKDLDGFQVTARALLAGLHRHR
ncbi:MAG: TetR/AcrR family transcriptional regulator [Proteobacteria bacterium]|nr:TetR/AcrR family transcriptional regulator [Pseudomonadota bacterium]